MPGVGTSACRPKLIPAVHYSTYMCNGNSIVVSVAAIIILSIIGGLFNVRHNPSFALTEYHHLCTLLMTCDAEIVKADMFTTQANHHSMVGETTDPPDGKAVAGSVFAAVIVYAV